MLKAYLNYIPRKNITTDSISVEKKTNNNRKTIFDIKFRNQQSAGPPTVTHMKN